MTRNDPVCPDGFLAIPDVDTANQEWNGNEPGMTQENLMKILKFWFIPGIPKDSTRNWWGRVKTSTF
jgi:hypothetical protein